MEIRVKWTKKSDVTECQRVTTVQVDLPIVDREPTDLESGILQMRSTYTDECGSTRQHRLSDVEISDTLASPPTTAQIIDAIQAQRTEKEQKARKALALNLDRAIDEIAAGNPDGYCYEKIDEEWLKKNRPALAEQHESLAKAKEAEKAEKAKKYKIENEERQARQKEQEAENKKTVALLVQKVATDSQKERFDAGVLPIDELHEIITDHLFQPGKKFERYKKLVSSDVAHGDECYNPSVSFFANTENEMTNALWQRQKQIIAAFDGIENCTVETRYHCASCECCDEQTLRHGVKVTIKFAGKHYTREYAV